MLSCSVKKSDLRRQKRSWHSANSTIVSSTEQDVQHCMFRIWPHPMLKVPISFYGSMCRSTNISRQDIVPLQIETLIGVFWALLKQFGAEFCQSQLRKIAFPVSSIFLYNFPFQKLRYRYFPLASLSREYTWWKVRKHTRILFQGRGAAIYWLVKTSL